MRAALVLYLADKLDDEERAGMLKRIAELSDEEILELMRRAKLKQGAKPAPPASASKKPAPLRAESSPPKTYAWHKGPMVPGTNKYKWHDSATGKTLFQVRQPGTGRGPVTVENEVAIRPTGITDPGGVMALAEFIQSLDLDSIQAPDIQKIADGVSKLSSPEVKTLLEVLEIDRPPQEAMAIAQKVRSQLGAT
jgi:hypothetical protein